MKEYERLKYWIEATFSVEPMILRPNGKATQATTPIDIDATVKALKANEIPPLPDGYVYVLTPKEDERN